MVRCWKRSETSLEDPQCMHCGPIGSSRFPHRVFWGSLTATLLIIIIALIVSGKLALQPETEGLICYKPDNQDTCFLRQMETSDYENMHVLLNESQQQMSQVWLVGNETQRHTEFLGVLAGSHVEASTLQEPLHTLCQQGPVYWTRKADGPKERLIYFCIDICFPSNICVSVCFYYLPE
ncbi:BRICHOS domain-containing protein 5 isoform X3 [Colossoma macropomum]|uniref:BRICHOS domain-containing protein 5 isoform X3 n=1 Tax=Colossoma macropomum TaxID=42526 RepID=UPI0018652EE6|nr:BRICHOS domain-containing protein 5 isoform X3 [Colossoma macropomum]